MIKINVLVVDDSIFMRNLIRKYLDADPSMQVIGEARNGMEAITKVKELHPDVITMDIEMPIMNGLDALKVIMRECPTPTVMLSSLTQSGAAETISALQIGAVDFVAKPSGSISLDVHKIKDELIAKIKIAAQAPKVKLQQLSTHIASQSKFLYKHSPGSEFKHIVAIGTSTGGPQALSVLLSRIPSSFQHPIVIVQHMPPKFTASLAQRLDNTSSLSVVEAKDGESIVSGKAYIAPGDYHMNVVERMGEYRISLHQRSVPGRHRPSVNELFASIHKLSKLKRHYVLMTGMGSDGAEEMLIGKQMGAASTIAEARESCIVYGMPRAAVEMGAADYVVPLEQIVQQLVKVTK